MKSLLRTGVPSVFAFLSTALLSLGISGGPDYGGHKRKTPISVTGSYAGTFRSTVPTNSLGLFSVLIPTSGLGLGTVSLFVTGNAYTGTIQATADPDSKQITGFVNAGFNYIKTVESGTDSTGKTTFTTITVRAVATGEIDAVVKRSSTNRTLARLEGTALMTFDPASAFDFDLPPSISYTVLGFKQSNL